MPSVFERLSDVGQQYPVLLVGLVLGFTAALVVRYQSSSWRKLPPGPSGLPFIGNALQLKNPQCLLFSAWRKIYGDLIYLNAAGQPLIVINKHSIASDLLDRRAGTYSDRPLNIVGCEIMTDGLIFGFSRYNDTWRRMRKGAHEAVNKVVADDLNESQVHEALMLVKNGLQDSASWDWYLRHASASLMLSFLYGERSLESGQDPRIRFINAFNEQLTSSTAPGAHWVEIMPWMRHIPSRLAAWKRTAEKWNKLGNETFCRLLGRVEENISNGDDRYSFCSTLIHEADRYGLSSQEIAWAAASMYSAGADTTASVMGWWTLAMVAHPEIQVKAQQELDAVVGRARIPTFADMPHLPYICAIAREVLRWRPVTPLGIPHRCTEDDVYDGYFIPEGSVIIVNVWELNQDPEMYGPDASEFNPTRYLDDRGQLIPDPPGAKDDGHFSFGFGRRVCVGKHVAINSLFIQIAICLWASTFANIKGQKVDAKAFTDEGVIIRPKPFQVDIKPRFPEAVALLSHECELHGR